MNDLVSVKFIWFYFMYLSSLEHFEVVRQRKLEATTKTRKNRDLWLGGKEKWKAREVIVAEMDETGIDEMSILVGFFVVVVRRHDILNVKCFFRMKRTLVILLSSRWAASFNFVFQPSKQEPEGSMEIHSYFISKSAAIMSLFSRPPCAESFWA